MKGIFLLAVFISCLGTRSFAAVDNCPCGDWLGALSVGSTNLRVIFHVSQEGESLHVTMDVPDQKAKGIAARKVEYADKQLKMSFGFASYAGIVKDDSTIEGTWSQNGQELPLLMHHVENLKLTEAPAPKRPQTPQPPFPYSSEDVTFTDSTQKITYGATITFPADNKKHPAILLITGSGQENRDEEIFGHKPFLVIADYLTRLGFVVLRVDDRGVGQTTGSLDGVTSKDFAADAGVELDYLKTRKEVDLKKIGLLGHSEGGMIAPMLAAKRKDVAFVISLSGPGIKTKSLMREQIEAVAKSQGISEEASTAYGKLYTSMVDSTLRYDNVKELAPAIEKVVRKWISATPEAIVVQTTNIRNDASVAKYSEILATQLSVPWMRYFLSVDPQPTIKALKCKVLVLNGEKDIQVVSKSNLVGWRTTLAKSKSKSYQVKELPGLNHLYQECKTCRMDEYEKLEQTFSPLALQTIGDWLLKETK